MNTRWKVASSLILLLAMIAVFVFWRRPAAKSSMPSASSSQAHASAPEAAPAPTDGPLPSAAPASTEPPLSAIPPNRKPSAELAWTIETLNHNPIEFYGRALDQFGDPVAGAEVRATVLVYTGTRGGEMKVQTTTDAAGYFQFSALRGQGLGIGFEKPGYEFRSSTSYFSFSYFEADHKRHIPDPNSPAVFILWKLRGAEPLVHYDIDRDIPANGTPIRINLETGQVGGPNADLIVTVTRTPLQMRFGQRGYAWSAAVEVVGGGLIRAGRQDYYNLAPETGYVTRLGFAQEHQNPRNYSVKWTWVDTLQDTFYISSRQGKNFARVDLRILANADRNEGDNIAAVRTVVWLNPHSSRNLEFDPAKAITPPR